jgi:hypothetical protein
MVVERAREGGRDSWRVGEEERRTQMMLERAWY